MPGHAHAAIKAMEVRYNTTPGLAAGEEYRLIDPNDTSFYISVQQWMDNAVNPCIESTYNFISKVIDTVVDLHKDIQPLKNYHFGGDEVAVGAWENSSKCIEFLMNNPQYNVSKGKFPKLSTCLSRLDVHLKLADSDMWEKTFFSYKQKDSFRMSLIDVTIQRQCQFRFSWTN